MTNDHFFADESDKAILDREAYIAGKEAYLNGDPIGSCPNFEHSDKGKRLRDMWRSGWAYAKHEQEIADYQNKHHE